MRFFTIVIQSLSMVHLNFAKGMQLAEFLTILDSFYASTTSNYTGGEVVGDGKPQSGGFSVSSIQTEHC